MDHGIAKYQFRDVLGLKRAPYCHFLLRHLNITSQEIVDHLSKLNTPLRTFLNYQSARRSQKFWQKDGIDSKIEQKSFVMKLDDIDYVNFIKDIEDMK